MDVETKRFWIINENNITEFEAERMGSIWVIWNYTRDDFADILIFKRCVKMGIDKIRWYGKYKDIDINKDFSVIDEEKVYIGIGIED